ncbi:MAG TPA: M23 family metallopeptidase [Lacipirellulaceae bacterium]|nr:M23 family metallopeptidase [Lacipirellulaceae bacterium]
MNTTSRYRCHCLVLAAWLIAAPAAAQPFVLPIGGTPFDDWTIVNYVDLDPAAGTIRDYRGGLYTYDGHNAIDYILPHFAAMDAGVPVYAAAPGTIAFTHDGEFDRCSRVNPCASSPNYVTIVHADGLITQYLHLKKDSISVSTGQGVVAGQQIGQVGSSGMSSDAHLHFSVYQNGNVIETNSDPARWWLEPLPYADDVAGSLDHGVVDHVPTEAEFVERPLEHDIYPRADASGQNVYLWSLLHGVDEGDDLDYYFYRPNGAEYAHLHWDAPDIRYDWWTGGVTLPAEPDLGTWRIEVQLNGAAIVSDSFSVLPTGDYNRDGAVDAADHIVWRKTLGQAVSAYAGADGDGDRMITQADYAIWRANFGVSISNGTIVAAVPEMASIVPLAQLLAFGCLALRNARRMR